MLTREENELIAAVGAGTPMGELMRRFWMPALLSSELSEPDCPPIRVRPFKHDETSVSPQIKAILETLAAHPRTNRKELANKLLANLANEAAMGNMASSTCL